MPRKKRRGSSVDNIIMVPVDPARRRRIRVYTAIAVVLALVASFVAGQITGRQGELAAEAREQVLAMELKRAREQLREAREEMAVYRTGAEMAEQAEQQVRGEIRTLRDQVAELEEAVAFYKKVMAPGSTEEGLHIEKFDLLPGDQPGDYRYRLVLTQLGDNRAYLAGQVQLGVSGKKADKNVVLGHSEILADGSETRFRFRYFQELSGQLSLPVDLTPDQITVEAVSTGRRRDRAEREFNWQSQEMNGARPG